MATLKNRPARVSNYSNEDIRDGIIRTFTDPLFEGATFEEIAQANETTLFVVRRVWEELGLQKLLIHARVVDEQLGLGMASYPQNVIVYALEELARRAREDEE